MNCPRCGQAVPDGSAFCNRCGASLAPAAPPAPLTPAASAPAAPPVPETEIWSGRFSGKSMGVSLIVLVALAGAIIVLFVAKPDLPRWLVLGLGGAWALYALVLLGRYLFSKWSIRYRLTTERLFEEKGIFRREVTELELVRVDDVSFTQNVVERLFDVGSVAVYSTDADEPRLVLHGIAAPEPVKEMIRAQMKRLRKDTINIQQV